MRLQMSFVAFLLSLSLMTGSAWVAVSDVEFKTRVQDATKDLVDLSATVNVTYADKKALAKVEANYSRFYEFKTAAVSLKMPDKIRIEGKLGMVRFEYIVNGPNKIFRAPKIRLSKKENYADDPAKLQNPLDFGLVTADLWRQRTVEVIDDTEAAANGEIKVRLRWPKGDMIYLAWVDERNLWLKKFEKRDAQENLRVRIIYSNPSNVGGRVWMPLKAEMYAPDGQLAGALEMNDVKFNSGLPDSAFE